MAVVENEIETEVDETLAETRKTVTLLCQPGCVYELRTAKSRKGIQSGYYNIPETLAKAGGRLSGNVENVYLTLNPVNKDLLARSVNRITDFAKHATGDSDIERRRWLLIDCDPLRPSGISSTDDEHDAAYAKAVDIWHFLHDSHGFRGMMIADSGNGFHILVPIDLPNDADATAVCKRFLEALAELFNDSEVTVDPCTCNASRVCKFYGTMACKGDSTTERPHRRSKIIWTPKTPGKIVTREQLEDVAATMTATTFADGAGEAGTGFNVDAWIEKHRVSITSKTPYNGGTMWKMNPCPWKSDHTDNAAYIVQLPNGAIAAGCHHSSCSEQNWHSLRDLVEPGWRGQHDTHSNDEHLSGWEEPKPLRSFVLPKFPVDALPDWGRDYVSALAEATQTPADLAGMMYLAVLSVSLQKKAKIILKPKWVEPLNLYLVSFLPSGERKTAVVSAMTSPISAYERRKEHSRNCDIADAKTEKKILEQQLKEVMGDDLTDPANEEKAKQIARQLETLKIPGSLRLLAEDCTPEMLVKLMEDNDGTISALSAEGDFCDIICGRYTEGKANLGVYLKAHTGEELRVDRINRPSNYVPNPALTLGLAVQPDVLNSLFENPSTRGRGLMARFLFGIKSLDSHGYREV